MILTMAARLLFLLSLILLLHLSIVPRVLDFVFCFFVLCNAAIDLIFYKQKIFCFFHLYIFSTRNKQNKMIFFPFFVFKCLCVLLVNFILFISFLFCRRNILENHILVDLDFSFCFVNEFMKKMTKCARLQGKGERNQTEKTWEKNISMINDETIFYFGKLLMLFFLFCSFKSLPLMYTYKKKHYINDFMIRCNVIIIKPMDSLFCSSSLLYSCKDTSNKIDSKMLGKKNLGK